jgi:HSP20 family protein
MALAQWTPMQNLRPLQEEMNRLFHEFVRSGSGGEAGWGTGTWTPPVDIYETDDALVLTVELPGISKEDVSIEIHQNTLMLRGQRKPPAGVQEDRYHRVERAYGAFQRSFTLPMIVNQDKVQASYKDGLLELRLPQSEAAKPKRIAITS